MLPPIYIHNDVYDVTHKKFYYTLRTTLLVTTNVNQPQKYLLTTGTSMNWKAFSYTICSLMWYNQVKCKFVKRSHKYKYLSTQAAVIFFLFGFVIVNYIWRFFVLNDERKTCQHCGVTLHFDGNEIKNSTKATFRLLDLLHILSVVI